MMASALAMLSADCHRVRGTAPVGTIWPLLSTRSSGENAPPSVCNVAHTRA